jgi:hypothetical protein
MEVRAHVAETASCADGDGICHDEDDDAATKATSMTIATVKTVASPSIFHRFHRQLTVKWVSRRKMHHFCHHDRSLPTMEVRTSVLHR